MLHWVPEIMLVISYLVKVGVKAYLFDEVGLYLVCVGVASDCWARKSRKKRLLKLIADQKINIKVNIIWLV
jgi:hypothetical protein